MMRVFKSLGITIFVVLLIVCFSFYIFTKRPSPQHDGKINTVHAWLTDFSMGDKLAPQLDLSFEKGHKKTSDSSSLTIAVDEGKKYQTMVGFGASFTDSSAWLVYEKMSPEQRKQLMTKLFSREKGIGLSMLRQPMGASDFSHSGNYSYDDMPKGESDPTLAHFSIVHDRAYIIPVLKQALEINPSLKIMATPWSPPGWMKTSDSMIGGTLKQSNYPVLANYFTKFIQAYQAQGIPISYVTPQNEPLYEQPGFPSMVLSREQEAEFIGQHLGPAFAKNGIDTKILGYDANWDDTKYLETLINDSNVSHYLDGISWHWYLGDSLSQTLVHNNYPNVPVFITEASGGTWQGGSEAAFRAIVNDLIIKGARNWSKSMILWNMALDPNNGPTNGGCDICRGVVTVSPNSGDVDYNVDYYGLGHISKFVSPGASRVASNTFGDNSIQDVVFQNPNGSYVLIAFNAGTSRETFNVFWGDESFSYSLNPGAAVTFTWDGQKYGNQSDEIYRKLANWQDVSFRNPDDSDATISYSPELLPFYHQVLDGTRQFTYSLPVGASMHPKGKEVELQSTNWKTSASSSAGGDVPENAIDGNPETRWSSGHGQTNGDWFQLDLGSQRTFNRIVLDATNSSRDFPYSYQVYVSDDAIHWGSTIAEGPGTGKLIQIPFASQTARYIRIVQTGSSNSWWSIGELHVYLNDSSGDAGIKSSTHPVENMTNLVQKVRVGLPEYLELQSFRSYDGSWVMVVYNSSTESHSFTVPLWAGEDLDYSLPAHAASIFRWNRTFGSTENLPSAPVITSLSPKTVYAGMEVVIKGSHFGTSQEDSTVKIGETMVPVSNWSDDAITITVPKTFSPEKTEIMVIVKGQSSQGTEFTIIPDP